MNELVSIIIPAYNSERWIHETVQSSLNQTWPHIEIIVVDDGSTDSTLSIARSLASRSVKVVTQPNSGVSVARNHGFRIAQGSYIQWLDADDLLAPNKIASQLQTAEPGQVSRTLLTGKFGSFYFCRERATITPTGLWRNLSPLDWLLVKFNDQVWMNPAVWLVGRKLTELAGPWDEQLVRDNDGEYISRVVASSDSVQFIPEAMSYYRITNLGSLSNSYSYRACESVVRSLGLCFGYLLSLENSERSRRACLSLMQSFMLMFDGEKTELLHKLHALASQLGGSVPAARVSWKQGFLEKIVGQRLAKRFLKSCIRAKYGTVSHYDRFFCQLCHQSH
jgi:glycosyltransferase involved in cell wall biosynthesis